MEEGPADETHLSQVGAAALTHLSLGRGEGGVQGTARLSTTACSSGLKPEPAGVDSPEPLSAAAAAMVVCCTPTAPVGRGGGVKRIGCWG